MAEKKPAKSDKPKRALLGRGRKPKDAAENAPINPNDRIRELQEELMRLRFQFATRQLTNTARIRVVRRDIARMKTLERQQQLAAEADAPARAS